jgi:hypothetical protein
MCRIFIIFLLAFFTKLSAQNYLVRLTSTDCINCNASTSILASRATATQPITILFAAASAPDSMELREYYKLDKTRFRLTFNDKLFTSFANQVKSYVVCYKTNKTNDTIELKRIGYYLTANDNEINLPCLTSEMARWSNVKLRGTIVGATNNFENKICIRNSKGDELRLHADSNILKEVYRYFYGEKYMDWYFYITKYQETFSNLQTRISDFEIVGDSVLTLIADCQLLKRLENENDTTNLQKQFVININLAKPTKMQIYELDLSPIFEKKLSIHFEKFLNDGKHLWIPAFGWNKDTVYNKILAGFSLKENKYINDTIANFQSPKYFRLFYNTANNLAEHNNTCFALCLGDSIYDIEKNRRIAIPPSLQKRMEKLGKIDFKAVLNTLKMPDFTGVFENHYVTKCNGEYELVYEQNNEASKSAKRIFTYCKLNETGKVLENKQIEINVERDKIKKIVGLLNRKLIYLVADELCFRTVEF